MKKKQKPAEKSLPATKPRVQNERLEGRKEIASFPGQPVALSQRWAKSGMPVTREDRFMDASQDGLSRYLGRDLVWTSLFILQTVNVDPSSDLKRVLSYERSGSKLRKRW